MLRFFLLINAPWTMLASIIKGFITISMKWKKTTWFIKLQKCMTNIEMFCLCHFIQYSIKSCFWWMVYITAWFESSKYINFLQKNLNIYFNIDTYKNKSTAEYFSSLTLYSKKCAHIHAFFEICKFAPPLEKTFEQVRMSDIIWKILTYLKFQYAVVLEEKVSELKLWPQYSFYLIMEHSVQVFQKKLKQLLSTIILQH